MRRKLICTYVKKENMEELLKNIEKYGKGVMWSKTETVKQFNPYIQRNIDKEGVYLYYSCKALAYSEANNICEEVVDNYTFVRLIELDY